MLVKYADKLGISVMSGGYWSSTEDTGDGKNIMPGYWRAGWQRGS